MAKILFHACLFAFLTLGAIANAADDISIGLGSYSTVLKAGTETRPPETIYTTGNLPSPIPTNKWYSSLLFTQWSEPLFAHPLSYKAAADGFQINVPEKVTIGSSREDIEVIYPHRRVLIVSPLAFSMQDARADKASDWTVDIVMGDGADALKATIAHGSPFSYYEVSRGDVQIRIAGTMQIFYRSPDQRVLGVKIFDTPYAIFGPTGAAWEETSKRSLTLRLPDKARYFSIAALPDHETTTIEDFTRYAYAFIRDTQTSWRYDEATSQVTTTFRVTTDIKEGPDNGTLLGLYPHQWYKNPLVGKTSPYQYDTIRGKLKLVSGKEFQTRYTYPGILPFWPKLSDAMQSARLAGYLDHDVQNAENLINVGSGSSYWQGKGLGRVAQLLSIAEQQGDMAKRDALLKLMKATMEAWLQSSDKDKKYFYYHQPIGALIAYPDEYGSAADINDHHFHYGYWINAAAQIALRDPAWAAKDKWGGMIDLLVADIATTNRKHSKFPFLRNFDPYEGHSWASGTALSADGNNQESSSEAIHAWASLILWGEATGDKSLRDTGIFLYTTEIQGINHYWFDLHRQVFAPEYVNIETSLLFGGKYAHTTWFSEDPRAIHGINLLPITAASLYLGADPDFVRRNIEATDSEFEAFVKRGNSAPADFWQDILLGYYALSDAKAALGRWNDKGLVEEGGTRTHTYYWIQSLINMGRPNFGVTANTPFYAVFRKPDGQNIYLAYNSGSVRKTVTFSDGTKLDAQPKSLTSISAPMKRKTN
ncbi:MAG TPA: glycosyl hydrolase [Burkholderiales bacterium]|nr:glycosyl hydrolase [Burkholderiales bacterium]